MGYFDSDNPTVDDIGNEFKKVWDALESDDDDEDPFDPDDLFEQASESARDEAIDTLEHLIDETCENERCQQIRDELGLGPADPDEDDSDESDADDDSNETTDDDETDDVQGDNGGSGDDDDPSDSDAESADDDDGGSDDSEPWSEDTNIFGESI